ncbi:MAG TPA: PDZ domain-containing protein [Bryobacteraceae bacterium]|nr:PDZ domain-containing protein [Bryobacteraceae bacterium]
MYRILLTCAVLATFSVEGLAAPPDDAMVFTVSMPHPASHRFHVSLRCGGLSGEIQDFKLPVWTPGFYRVLDYAQFVHDFHAEDDAGRPLPWEKVTKNAWRVVTGGAAAVLVNYDVEATVSFVARSYLDDQRAFIAPAAIFMHPAGRLRQPVTASFQMPAIWRHIATGLDPVPGQPNTFRAPDFDVLYDSPILLGNQEILQFTAAGRPHTVAMENVPAGVNREKITSDLQRMVQAATRLIGDVPYQHYTFLLMGKGNGGIEHANSAAISFNGESLLKEEGYLRWLSYVAHEYFHTFNVKRIRPLALGPFDYDQENLTDMLWVSEGLSVYYQDLVLVRAGLMSREQYLEKMAAAITRFENAPGHRYESAAEASLNTWGTSPVAVDRSTSISYYDNGAMLGALLDLSIRQESHNRDSLDDVMRSLYRDYYQRRRRGFTGAEFRAECEKAAGRSLAEVFDYVIASREMDYAKYLGYAGLRVERLTDAAPGAYLGVNTKTQDNGLEVTDIEADSPARAAGLAVEDHILELDGAQATAKNLQDMLSSKKPGDKVKLQFSRSGVTQEIDIVLGQNSKRTYKITALDAPNPLQSAVLADWLKRW